MAKFKPYRKKQPTFLSPSLEDHVPASHSVVRQEPLAPDIIGLSGAQGTGPKKPAARFRSNR